MEEMKSKFDISQYVRLVVRRKWFFIVPLVLIFAASIAAIFLYPKYYQARAIILVEEKQVVNPLLKDLAVSTTVKDRLNTVREEILSWPRLFQLVERLGLNKEIKDPLAIEKLIAGIRNNIHLEMRSNDIVIISYRGEDPKSTQLLVNTLCDILIERNVASSKEATESAIDFINEQLVIYKEKLDASESKLREFKEVYGLHMASQQHTSVQAVTPTQTDETASLKTPLNQVNEELASLEAELMLTRVDCTDEHPRVKDLKRRIEDLKEKREQYITDVAERAGVDAQTYLNISDSMPRQEEMMAQLTRDKTINERIYAMLLERLETAKITERLETSENKLKFKIIEPARLPLVPVRPSNTVFGLMGLLLGSVCGFGSVYFVDYMDSSYKTQDQLTEHFGYPVLGSISRIITAGEIDRKNARVKRIWSSVILTAVFLAVVIYYLLKVAGNL